jgi:hypothetical protein
MEWEPRGSDRGSVREPIADADPYERAGTIGARDRPNRTALVIPEVAPDEFAEDMPPELFAAQLAGVDKLPIERQAAVLDKLNDRLENLLVAGDINSEVFAKAQAVVSARRAGVSDWTKSTTGFSARALIPRVRLSARLDRVRG